MRHIRELCAIMESLKRQITEKGYYLTSIASKEEFISLCKMLGSFNVNRIGGDELKILKPLSKSEAHPNSLSALYGLSAFPFHTDGAHKLTPPRLLAFRYIGTSANPEPTLLLDFNSRKLNSKEEYFLNNRIWKIHDGRKVFYRSIKNPQSRFLRLDTGCMTLTDNTDEDKEFLRDLINKFDTIRISWKLNKTLIVDNWRMLHSRPQISLINKDKRILERINIS